MQARNKYMVAIGITALLCGGCSYIPGLESDKVDYKSARRLPPLEIPPGLARPSTDSSYSVQDGKGDTTFSAYSKERVVAGEAAATLLPQSRDARIERAGAQRWLVVKADPKAVWNVTRDFWSGSGFAIASENPSTGVMETDWIDSREKIPDDNPLRGFLARALARTSIGTVGAPTALAQRAKFRTRLEAGTEPGTTEIYISHQGMEETKVATSSDQAVWKSQPSNPEFEAEMLTKLMVQFGIKQEVAQAKVAAAAEQERAKLVKGATGAGRLSVNDEFDRAWRRVGLALDRVGFTVEDRDRSKGLYFVRYLDPDAGKAAQAKGFLARINPFSKDTKAVSSDQYRIQVKDAASTSEVSVLSKDGAEDNSETANRILGLLYEQLK